MEGLSVKDEMFAIRLLELARLASPRGNRVEFVRFCEAEGLRSFLEQFPEVWSQITDSPPREGITSAQTRHSERASFAIQAAAFQELVESQMGVPHFWIDGLSLSHLLYGDITGREFHKLHLFVAPEQLFSSLEVLNDLGFDAGTLPGSRQRRALARWGDRWELHHQQSGLMLTLHWRLFSKWIGTDLISFDECWERSRSLTWEGLSDWKTLGAADTVTYLALSGWQTGWSGMGQLLDLVIALEVLDYTWDQVLDIAGSRAVLVERAVELCVRLLGVPHPGRMTFHFSDYRAALHSWSHRLEADRLPGPALLEPHLWSCPPSEALRRRLEAMTTPGPELIQAVSLPAALWWLYPVLQGLKTLLGRG